MISRKVLYESYHINDFEKNPAHSIRDDLDPEEDEEMIEELDNAKTILTTGIGIIIKDDSMNSLRRIEHWICHTNFDINLQVLALTDAFEGVETLTVVTRYQMIIGFGRLFDIPEVKKKLEKALINIEEIPVQDINRLVQRLKRRTFLGVN